VDALMDHKLRPLHKAHVTVVTLVRFLLQMCPEMLHQMALVPFSANIALEGFFSPVEAGQVLLQTISPGERFAAHFTTELFETKVPLQMHLQVARRTERNIAQLTSVWLLTPKLKKIKYY
jgi:hypothetical protein